MSTEVNLTDQAKINEFSTLNHQFSTIQEKILTLNDKKESYHDAITELELFDDTEIIPYQVGNSFVNIPASKAIITLQESYDQTTGEIESLSLNLKEIDRRMAVLKTTLYAKFGKNINLERE